MRCGGGGGSQEAAAGAQPSKWEGGQREKRFRGNVRAYLEKNIELLRERRRGLRFAAPVAALLGNVANSLSGRCCCWRPKQVDLEDLERRLTIWMRRCMLRSEPCERRVDAEDPGEVDRIGGYRRKMKAAQLGLVKTIFAETSAG